MTFTIYGNYITWAFIQIDYVLALLVYVWLIVLFVFKDRPRFAAACRCSIKYSLRMLAHMFAWNCFLYDWWNPDLCYKASSWVPQSLQNGNGCCVTISIQNRKFRITMSYSVIVPIFATILYESFLSIIKVKLLFHFCCSHRLKTAAHPNCVLCDVIIFRTVGWVISRNTAR